MLAKSLSLAAVVAAVFLLSSASVGVGATTLRPAPGTPDPRPMVIASKDVGGAKIDSQHYYKDKDFPSSISYSREFDAGRFGAARFLYLDSEAEIGTSAGATASFLADLRRVLATKQFATQFAKGFEDGGEGFVKVVHVGRPRSFGVGGPGSFDLLVTLKILGAHADVHIAAFSVERVLGELVVVGQPGRRIPVSTMTRLAKLMGGRMSSTLAPRNTAAPTIAGNPQVGQALLASAGSWTGGSSTFTYQWQRCDAAGSGCADVSLATGQSYTLTTADTGATMRVAVTARNTVAAATATSSVTA